MDDARIEDWFMNCFFPQVREYCLEKDIPFKTLLVLKSSPVYTPHPEVKFIFILPNTTPFIQPMDQGLIATVKTKYLRTTFVQAISALDTDSELIL